MQRVAVFDDISQTSNGGGPINHACKKLACSLTRLYEAVDGRALADALALLEGRRIEFLQSDFAGEHLALSGLVLRFAGVELGHDLLGEQLQALADVDVRVGPAWLSRMMLSMFDVANFRSLSRMVAGEPMSSPRRAFSTASGLACFHA